MAILQLTEHFHLGEFLCPCCDRVKINDMFERHVDLLERMRTELGFAIDITSGYRCEKHNKAITDSASNSWHMRVATDIRPQDRAPKKLKLMLAKAEELGFTGIGTYLTWVHVDLRPYPARWRG